MIKGSVFNCYYGAKSQIVEKILPHFPRGPETYVETCFGSGALFFALPEGLYPNRVINDLNKGVVTFYKVLRERPDDLLRVCELTPFAFDEQRACRDWTQDPEDELELARRVWVRQSQNFAGMQQTIEGFRRGTPKCSVARIAQNKLAQFHEYAKFFRGVEINNTDAVDLVRYYGKAGSFIYCMHPDTIVRKLPSEDFVRVEDIKEGDRIAPGRTVLSKMSRHHSGDILSIKIQGMIDELKVTPEHRIICIPGRSPNKRQDIRTNEQLWNLRSLKPASDLKVGDYVLVPLGGVGVEPLWDWRTIGAKKGKLKPSCFNPNQLLYRFLGYYAAEGFVLREKRNQRPVSVGWGFCVDELDTYIPDLNKICKEVFGLSCGWARFRDTGTARVWCYSTALAEFVTKYVPGLALTKALHSDLMSAPPESQLELLKGWMRGDGGFDKSSRNRCKLSGTTASPILARQMFTIALRCGLKPSMKQRGRVYDVYFASEDAKKLGWDIEARRFRSSRRVINGHMLTRVREISRTHYDGVVYDLDVDGDDLFTAQNILIHNCDPPYHPSSRGAGHGYQHEMDASWHEKLLEANLEASKKGALIAISGYAGDFYDNAYKDWRRVEYTANAKSANFLDAEDRQKTEVIWMNYPESVEIRHGFKPKFTASNKLEQVLQKTLKREGRTR